MIYYTDEQTDPPRVGSNGGGRGVFLVLFSGARLQLEGKNERRTLIQVQSFYSQQPVH